MQIASRLVVLVAAREEEERIGRCVRALRAALPEAAVVVCDDGSRDRTAERAREAGARVVSAPRLGKGEALTAGERKAGPGPLLLCDADVEGDLRPLTETGADLAIAVFAERIGGGIGLAKRVARALVRSRSGLAPREPLSGQRYLSERARAACFPLARGFGGEVRMTMDAARGGLAIEEVELPLRHRATGRDLGGFLHRGRQLADALLAAGPLAVNHRGNRLPLVGLLVSLGGLRAPRRVALAVALVDIVGFVDDVWSGPERGWRSHLARGGTTGVLKLVTIPVSGLLATGSGSGALLVALCANALNLLDTRPGRALKAFLGAAAAVGGPALPYAPVAVLLLPYDLREKAMLGDAGSNALGAVLGLSLVARLRGRSRWLAIGLLAGLNALGDRRSLAGMIEGTPILARLDDVGRVH